MHDDPSPSTTATSRVELGHIVLIVGDPAGIAIAEDAAQGDPGPLAKAVARSAKEPAPQPSTDPEPVDEKIESVSDVTSRLEHSLQLFTEFAEGRCDLTSLSDEADFLLDLLERLDRHKRWADAIRVARMLSKLLALLARWKELLRSLRLALSLAERLGDDDGMAWALHELGTLHLAVDRQAAGDSLLTHAREIRQRTGDRHALAITERNLQVLCRTLRADIHRSRWQRLKQIPNARTLALVIAASMLVVGGAAGAIINGSGDSPPPPAPSVTIESTPEFPRPGEQVSFKVISSSKADPYFWWFGDGRSSSAANPRHVYRQPGHYRAIVTVTDRDGAILGSATQMIVVARPSPPYHSVKRTDGETVKGQTSKEEEGQTSKPTGKLRTSKLTVKIAHAERVTSTMTSICPASPVLLGEPFRVGGAVAPAPASASPVTVTFTDPSRAAYSQTASTDAEGAYTSASKANQVGEWSVSSSWPGDTSLTPATSEGCSFEVRSLRELYLRSSKSSTSKRSTTVSEEPNAASG